MSPERFKACVDCRHFNYAGEDGVPRASCRARAAVLPRSPVFGSKQWQSAAAMRSKTNKHCGPEGNLWEGHPTPWADRWQVVQLWTAWYAGRTVAAPSMALHAVGAKIARLGQRWRAAKQAFRSVHDNTGKPEPERVVALVAISLDDKTDQPIEPLPPEEPAPQPKPGDLPQTDGKALVVAEPRVAVPGGGTSQGSPAMSAAVAVLLAGYIVAGLIGEARREVCCYKGPDGVKCYPCERAVLR